MDHHRKSNSINDAAVALSDNEDTNPQAKTKKLLYIGANFHLNGRKSLTSLPMFHV